MTEQPGEQPGQQSGGSQPGGQPAPPPPPPPVWPYPGPAAPPPGQPYPGPTGQPYPAQPYPAQAHPAQAYPAAYLPTSTNAIIALVLSIASWVICPIVPAVVALVLAQSASREIRRGAATGDGLVTASRVVSWLNIGLFGLLLVIFGLVLLVSLIAGSP